MSPYRGLWSIFGIVWPRLGHINISFFNGLWKVVVRRSHKNISKYYLRHRHSDKSKRTTIHLVCRTFRLAWNNNKNNICRHATVKCLEKSFLKPVFSLLHFSAFKIKTFSLHSDATTILYSRLRNYLVSGQSYKASKIVHYDSRLVNYYRKLFITRLATAQHQNKIADNWIRT